MSKYRTFLTGSHAYGFPHEGSDIDVVMLTSEFYMNKLAILTEKVLFKEEVGGASMYFGNLNLIVFTDEARFKEWWKVTDELIARKPVTREDAIKAFNEVGLTGFSAGANNAIE